MNDNEIKKALECCLETRHDCSDCLLEKEVYCTSLLHKSILDLINRQQAEIERLKYLLEREEKATESFSKQCYKDGIKEFADLSIKRICEQVSAPTPSESYIVEKCNETIDNLLKEKVGGENA